MKKQSIYSRQAIKRISDYPDVLTVQEASELLGICTKTLYKMLKRGDIQKQNVGRLIRIPKSNIISYLGLDSKK